MAFAEDPSVFLADFGVPCQAGSVQFVALLDQPDEAMHLQRAAPLSRQYELVFATADVALARGVAVTVNGQAYHVREEPRQVDDGVFSRVLLTKD